MGRGTPRHGGSAWREKLGHRSSSGQCRLDDCVRVRARTSVPPLRLVTSARRSRTWPCLPPLQAAAGRGVAVLPIRASCDAAARPLKAAPRRAQQTPFLLVSVSARCPDLAGRPAGRLVLVLPSGGPGAATAHALQYRTSPSSSVRLRCALCFLSCMHAPWSGLGRPCAPWVSSRTVDCRCLYTHVPPYVLPQITTVRPCHWLPFDRSCSFLPRQAGFNHL